MPSCSIEHCKSRHGTNDNIKFHRFPVKRRKLWERVINRSNWKATPGSRICSRHFVSGYPGWEKSDPDWVPSLFINPTPVGGALLKGCENGPTNIIDTSLINWTKTKRPQTEKNTFKEFNGADSLKTSLHFHDYAQNSISQTADETKSYACRSIGVQTSVDQLQYENQCLRNKLGVYREMLRLNSGLSTDETITADHDPNDQFLTIKTEIE